MQTPQHYCSCYFCLPNADAGIDSAFQRMKIMIFGVGDVGGDECINRMIGRLFARFVRYVDYPIVEIRRRIL